ncbi:MAG: AAA family ATPase [Bacteroidales bacterium]|nr:AAA family ATPase [Bacteroidales bacterium]
MKFTIKNFKSFGQEGVSLDLKPINILTGTNSSGKSSFVKAYLLLSDFLSQLKGIDVRDCVLRFSDERLQMGSFKTVLNQDSKAKDDIVFQYEARFMEQILNVQICFQPYNNDNLGFARLKSLTIYSGDNLLIGMDGNGRRCYDFSPIRSLYLDLLRINNNDDSSWEGTAFSFQREFPSREDALELALKMLARNSVFILPIMDEIYEFSPDEFNTFCQSRLKNCDDGRYPSLVEHVVKHYSDSGYLRFGDFFSDLENSYSRLLFDDLSINNISGNAKDYPDLLDEPFFCSSELPTFDLNLKHASEFELVLSLVFKLSYPDEEADVAARDSVLSLVYLKSVVDELESEVLHPSAFESVVYIPSEKVSVKRLYSLDRGKDSFQNGLLDYFDSVERYLDEKGRRLHFKPSEYDFNPGDFMNKWVKSFGIGDRLEIKPTTEGLGVIIKLYQSSEDKVGRLLADEGYGISQLVSILLYSESCILKRIGSFQFKDGIPLVNKYKLLIEEPEIHLHPRLQSLLADMIWELAIKYKIRSIVETHSEYLVRRIQVICAKYATEQKISNNEMKDKCPVRVFYFEKGKGAYDLEIQSNGKFKNEFGSGFFDEAANLAFDIF